MAQSWLSKKTPSKFVDACRVCDETFSLVKIKHDLLLGQNSSVQLDYLLALETLQDKIHREVDDPKWCIKSMLSFLC